MQFTAANAKPNIIDIQNRATVLARIESSFWFFTDVYLRSQNPLFVLLLFSFLVIVNASIIRRKAFSESVRMKRAERALLSEIMTTNIVTIDITERVEEAIRLMVKFDIGSVVVTDKQKPVGIITERDVTRAALRGDSLLRLPVRSLMSRPLQTGTPDMEIWRTFETMLRLGVRRLPLIENGKLVGIVTEKDLTRWVLRVFYEPKLPNEIRSLVNNQKIEALTGRQRCPSCGRYRDECICVRTQVASEE
jgi:CBS domain-containing protein